VLTSRNAGLCVRRRIADRRPDWIKSNGGGANAILVRGTLRGHARRRLAVWPERRVLHGVWLGDGLLVANLHLTVHRPAQATLEARAAHAAAARWSAGAPFVLGGDFNLGRDLHLPGLRRVALNGPDHVWAAGLEPAGRAEVLDRRDLSDHAPVVVALRRSG
jgi:endonuclease/exonuclease/phosphatase family metal-dependent hydrolase